MIGQTHLELKKKWCPNFGRLCVCIDISTYFATMVRIKSNTESADYLQKLQEEVKRPKIKRKI